MAVEREDHRDLVGVCQLRRAAVEPLFLLPFVFVLAEVGPQGPVGDTDAAVVRGLRCTSAQKARRDAKACQDNQAHRSPPRTQHAMSLHCFVFALLRVQLKANPYRKARKGQVRTDPMKSTACECCLMGPLYRQSAFL